MTPDEIYLRTISVERARPVPAYVSYAVAFRGEGATIGCPHGRIVITFGSGHSKAQYRVSYRGSDGTASDVDAASGDACEGVPLISAVGGDLAKLLEASPAFGPAPLTDEGATPIASVRAQGVFHYAVVSATPEVLAARAVLHLTLHALRDPETYPLTDLYVDASDYRIERVVGSFSDRFGGAPATIVATGDFEVVERYAVQTHEHVEFTARTQPQTTRATLDATASSITFSN